MPQYPVLQPNGNLAVWSTIVDCFIALDCTPEEAAEVLGQRYSDKVKVVQAITAIKNGEQPREEWNDWAECVAWAMFRFGAEDETVKQAMTLTPDPMTRRYITTFVALIQAEGAQQDAEWRQEQAQAQLAAVTARAEAAERHNGQVLYLLCNYGHFTATAHRTWLLDQIARELLGTGYDSWMECLEADGLSWGTGEPPK